MSSDFDSDFDVVVVEDKGRDNCAKWPQRKTWRYATTLYLAFITTYYIGVSAVTSAESGTEFEGKYINPDSAPTSEISKDLDTNKGSRAAVADAQIDVVQVESESGILSLQQHFHSSFSYHSFLPSLGHC
ncbi:hypothetical protein K503DRAFT_92361 [Rhizopogon vinicolor AM-OR11-026]|uniref:Uncharacterized protein n=1 Tax=Rhizopogon vinicolor AM-OR11-026 TaxID=1314800 RepID=A0A1B7N3E6_9AGAM|nr:hypothetical protein K503DRAFT_92361 [Rhizopogon vinicolor AM-OR11-026]